MKGLATVFFFFLWTHTLGQELLAVKTFPCTKAVDSDYVKDRLVSKEKRGDTTIIEVELVKNCHFIPDINLCFSNDTVYLKIRNKSDLFAACKCAFKIELKVAGIADTNFVVVHNYLSNVLINNGIEEIVTEVVLESSQNRYIFPTLAEIGMDSDVNQLNTDSLKIGIWISDLKEPNLNKTKALYFLDSNNESVVKWIVFYDSEEKIEKICSSVSGEQGSKYLSCINWKKYLELIDTDH